MPRFHFDVHDGASQLDKKRTVLPDWEAARIEAICFAGHILQDEAKRTALGEDWPIEVTDHTGLILFQITLQMVTSPALEHSAR
jgi:hypothetical protein